MSNKELAVDSITALRRNPQRLVPELVSISNETNGRPDPFNIIVSKDGLRDPITGRLVREIIDRQSPLGKIEARFLDGMEALAPEKDEGVFVWISPPHPKRSQYSKVVFYRIVYALDGQKVTDDLSILFGANTSQAIKIASEISGKSFIDSEDLRGTPLFFEDDEETIQKVLELISYYPLPFNDSDENDTQKKAEMYAVMIKNGVPARLIVEHMQKTRFLGEIPIGCLPTFMEYTLRHSLTTKYVENCGNCGAHIGKPIPKGFCCPNCGGIYEGC
jgi:hypothetical protein